jgi:hypothetical protein
MLGSTLRQAREVRQLPLSEIEWATHIKAGYLAALEAEDYDRLPGTTYARGFIRIYANYLGIDPEPLVAEYNAAYPGAQEVVSTKPPITVRRQRLAITPGLIVGLVLVVLAALFGVYVKGQFDRYQATRGANAQPSSHPLVPTDLPSVSPAPSPSPSASPSPVYAGVHLVLRVDDSVWLRVEVDGKVSDQTSAGGKVFPAGSTITLDGTQTVHVRSGKAPHTFVALNGKDLGAMPSSEAGNIGDQTYKKAG